MRSLRTILLAIVATVALLGAFGSVADAGSRPDKLVSFEPRPAMLESDPGDPGIPD
jgi:hypothetical protein